MIYNFEQINLLIYNSAMAFSGTSYIKNINFL